MGNAAGLNNAPTADVLMGLLYGLTAVVLLVAAYIIYTKQFRQRQKLQAVDTVNLITTKYNLFTEKTQLLIEVTSEMTVRLDLLDISENPVANLLDKTLPEGEHIVEFDPQQYGAGQYYFKLTSAATTILKKIKIS